VDVLDVRDHPLPPYDLAAPPARAFRQYESAEHREVGERLDAADGFLLLTNEFNHGYSGAVKNLLDHYFVELVHKPVAFVGYGNVGGARAIEQLRLVAAELDMVSVRETVNITGFEMRDLRLGDPADAARIWAVHLPKLEAMLANLLWWSRTLRAGRAG
jgi:NAD(P)H-dependent FMN reductase